MVSKWHIFFNKIFLILQKFFNDNDCALVMEAASFFFEAFFPRKKRYSGQHDLDIARNVAISRERPRENLNYLLVNSSFIKSLRCSRKASTEIEISQKEMPNEINKHNKLDENK